MSPGIALLLVVLLILANGVFVAAEFALVSVRRGAIEEKAEQGDRRARLVLHELEQLSFVLSAAQFGITVTSLLVGFLAEVAFGDTLLRPLAEAVGLPEASSTAIAIGGAFLLSTMIQMLFGELAPKNAAIARPERIALAITPLMRAFEFVFRPIILLFDRSAEWVSRKAFGVDAEAELLAGHNLEDLSRIIAASGEEGALSETQTELLSRAIELGDRRIAEVMVPRPDVLFLAATDRVGDLREVARRTGHSRFPVRGETEDDIVGTVHIKDAFDTPDTRLGDLAAPALIVPESELVRRLLGHMRTGQRTFAVVVDEYGGTAGIVTIEDIVEELVGEIEDEFDRDAGPIRRIGAGRFLIRGTLRKDRVAEALGVELPEGEYETIAGFVIDRLGHIPDVGEEVVHDGWRFEVRGVEGVRVAELLVQRPATGPVDRAATGEWGA